MAKVLESLAVYKNLMLAIMAIGVSVLLYKLYRPDESAQYTDLPRDLPVDLPVALPVVHVPQPVVDVQLVPDEDYEDPVLKTLPTAPVVEHVEAPVVPPYAPRVIRWQYEAMNGRYSSGKVKNKSHVASNRWSSV